MRKISKIEPVVLALPFRKKVAAYARVSKNTERLAHSLSAQISYYSELIQNNPEWEYAGVYADYGITGTSTEGRQEFMRLLQDCENGKINFGGGVQRRQRRFWWGFHRGEQPLGAGFQKGCGTPFCRGIQGGSAPLAHDIGLQSLGNL